MPDPYGLIPQGIWGDEFRQAGGMPVQDVLAQQEAESTARQQAYENTLRAYQEDQQRAAEEQQQAAYAKSAQEFVDWPMYQEKVAKPGQNPQQVYQDYVGEALPWQLQQQGYTPEEVQQAVQEFSRMVPQPAADYGFFGNLLNSATSGAESGTRAIEAAAAAGVGDTERLAKLVAGQEGPNAPMERFQKALGEQNPNLSAMDVVQRIASAGLQEPVGLLNFFVNQITQSYPVMAGSLALGAAGSLAGPAGTVAGVGGGAATGSTALDAGSTILEGLVNEANSRGINPNDTAAMVQLLSDPAVKERIVSDGLKHGIPVGLMDGALAAVSFGIGGSIARSVRAGNKLAAGLKGAGGLALEAGGGAAGEALGQVNQFGEVRQPIDVGLEALGEIGPGVAHAGAGAVVDTLRAANRVPVPTPTPLGGGVEESDMAAAGGPPDYGQAGFMQERPPLLALPSPQDVAIRMGQVVDAAQQAVYEVPSNPLFDTLDRVSPGWRENASRTLEEPKPVEPLNVNDADELRGWLFENAGVQARSIEINTIIDAIAQAPEDSKRFIIADAIAELADSTSRDAEPMSKALLQLSRTLPKPERDAQAIVDQFTVPPSETLLDTIKRVTGQLGNATERSAREQAWVNHFLSLPRSLEAEQQRREVIADQAWQRAEEAARVESMLQTYDRVPVDQAALDSASQRLDNIIAQVGNKTPTSRANLLKLRERAQLLLEESVDAYNRNFGERSDAGGGGVGAVGAGGPRINPKTGRPARVTLLTPLQYRYLNTLGGKHDITGSVGARRIADTLGIDPEGVVSTVAEALAKVTVGEPLVRPLAGNEQLPAALTPAERGLKRGLRATARREAALAGGKARTGVPRYSVVPTDTGQARRLQARGAFLTLADLGLTGPENEGTYNAQAPDLYRNRPYAEAVASEARARRDAARRPANVLRRGLQPGELIPTADIIAGQRGPVEAGPGAQAAAAEPGVGVPAGVNQEGAGVGNSPGGAVRQGLRRGGAQAAIGEQPDAVGGNKGLPRRVIGTAYPEGERRLGKPPGSVRQVNADVRLIEENLVKEDKLRRVSERAAQKSKSEKLSLKRREREQRKALSELARAADEERGGLVAPDERIDALKNAYEKIYPSADFDEDLGGVVEVRRDADAVGANRGLTPEQVTNMSGTPEQVLTYLQSVMQSPLGRIVAGQIKQLGLDLPAIEWGPIASNTPGSSAPVMGRYRSTRRSDRPGIQHKIMVDPARADLETVLHEFVHAATMRLLEQPETPAHVQVRNQLQALMEYSQDQSAELASQYGFTNVLEFVAEALSNPEFQRTLAKIPLPYTPRVSVFDAIKRLILRLFGVTNENNVLSEVFGLSKAVMSGKQISVEDAANAEAAPRAVPSTAILGTTNGARTQIAYQGRNGAYTIYTVTPQNYRGDPATKEAGLTRTQVEQRIRDAGAQVVSPAADTRPAPGTPKNTSTKLVGYGTDGALKAAAFEQKDGTWTYYESTGDVRTDPDARVVKGLSKDAAQRYIAAKGYSPEPPAGGVRPHGDTPTAVGYDPASAFRVSFQDTEAALKNFNRNLPVDQRVDIAATLRNSRAMARIKQVMKQYVEPARKAGEEITQRFGKTQEQVENTLAQLHIAERMNNKIRQIQRGNMDASRQAAAIADVTRKGNAAAAEIARERGSNPAYVQAVQQQLATAVKALSDNTIDLSAQYGLISRQTAENIKAAYDYYVPLQIGEKTTTGKAATGQNVQTDRSFARMVEQMMRTISRGEMNRIRGVIFDAAERSGVTRNDTGENVVHIGTTPVIRYDPITNSLNDGTDSHIFDPNSVDFYREGSRYRMTISEPSLLEALHPYKGEERKTAIDALVGTLAFVNHTIAIGKTALSPIFGPFNMLRDMGTAMVNLPEGVSRVQLTKQLMNPETYIAAAQGTLQDAWGTDQTGRFGQAATAGALVSQRAYLGLDQTARDIETQFNPSVVSKTKAKSDTLFKFLTAGSQFFESVTRYAVYKAALDSGLSQTEAAFAAKTASVNFEQRGLHNLSNYWIFGNAKIQSLNALRETFKRKGISPTTVSATAGMILLGAAAAAIGLRDSEKDKDGKSKYSKIPDYKKDSMILFREGAAGIPIPQEIAPFYVLGNALMEAKKLGGDKSGSEVASRIFTSALNQLWPGNVPQQDVAGHKARPAEFLMRVVLPSQAMPLVDIVTNRNTFGSPVVSGKDDKLKRGVPSHLMGSPDENQLAVNVAQGMYDVTGGLLDVAPQQLKLLNNYFNPATEGYAFIRDALGMRDAKYQGDIVNPLARKFTGVATQFYDQDQFDSLLAKATQAKYLATMNGINTLSPEDQVLARSADMLSKVNSDANNLFKGNKLLTKDRRALLNDRKQELLLDGIRRYNELRDRSVR